MLKVVVITALVVTMMGAAGVAVYDNSKANSVQSQNLNTTSTTADMTTASEPVPIQNLDVANVTTDTTINSSSETTAQLQGVGQPWFASGILASIDAFGFELTAASTGETLYFELGPSTYWQTQGVVLVVGDYVQVQGFAQDGVYHAAVVTKSDGSQLIVRDAVSGQPLWSGSGNAGQNQTATTSSEPQVTAEQWVTVEGVVTAGAQNSLTVTLTDGTVLTTQLGRPAFAAEQNVTFAVGDQVRVISYDSNGQFQVGEIDNLTQNTRLMLRDPNGRPLWAGPGGQAQGGLGQNGQGGQGQNRGGSQGNGNRNGRSN